MNSILHSFILSNPILLCFFFGPTSDLLVRFRLDCLHKHVSRSIPRLFANNYVQEVGTYIQDAHSSPSIKGKSRSASKKRTIHNALDSDHVIDADSKTSTLATLPKKIKYRRVVPLIKHPLLSLISL